MPGWNLEHRYFSSLEQTDRVGSFHIVYSYYYQISHNYSLYCRLQYFISYTSLCICEKSVFYVPTYISGASSGFTGFGLSTFLQRLNSINRPHKDVQKYCFGPISIYFNFTMCFYCLTRYTIWLHPHIGTMNKQQFPTNKKPFLHTNIIN